MSPRSAKKPLRVEDPHAAREAEKYQNPIPSREFILSCLAERGELLRFEALARLLDLTSDDELEALRRRLRAMQRDGQLIYTRRGYAPVDELDLVRGRVVGHSDGFGFLVPEDGGDDLFLPVRQMAGVLHGDRVVARVASIDQRGRREAAIVEVLERANERVVGRYFSESGVGFVTPDNKRINQDIAIPADQSGEARNGQFVVVEIIQQPTFRRQPIGRVVEILGDHMAPGMEIDVAIRAHGLPCEWSEAVLEEIADFGEQVPESAKRDRKDLRALPLVTIDGADARDFDDAVYCERTSKGWRLLVAIADVSHYVAPETALDQAARERGNSVYFPERVIPMLPEVLSNGLCSLNPEVDRLCMVCEMYISGAGKIIRSRFYDAVMRSHARLTYEDAAAMMVDGDTALRQRYAALVSHLDELYALYQVLRRAREQRGAIDFSTTETRIIFGADRKIDRIVPVVRNDAHKLIEECMIAANVCAARFMTRYKMPALYRVHEPPDNEKLTELRKFLSELGLQLGGGKKPQAQHYAKLIAQIEGRADAHMIQSVLLRSLQQANYTPENLGHFGLAQPAYAHFTSPIRRYPDLLLHRGIRHVLEQGEAHDFVYDQEQMGAHGERCSMTERRADDATRDVINWLKCEFMLDKIGASFDGVISAVTGFGIFVELDDIFVEGLVHITALGNDYYHYDAAGHRLIGDRTARMFRLGDAVRVVVVRVELDERKIDFELHPDSLVKTASAAQSGASKHSATKKSSAKAGGKKKTAAKRKKQSTKRGRSAGGGRRRRG